MRPKLEHMCAKMEVSAALESHFSYLINDRD